MEPITFQPLYMERVWGGRELQTRFERALPDDSSPIGESWEIVDRVEHQSVVDHGPLQGTTLHELWTKRRHEIFGECPDSERFPLLLKILDTQQDLSLQVHPPEAIAGELHGEAKNEMWYIIDHLPGAKLHVGLCDGIGRNEFTHAIERGRVTECIHSVEAKAGDSILIPSGRLHAIGGGFLIHEIQQNSDTTYRVHDWDRPGLDGEPRQLHIEASMRCINFDDVEPTVTEGDCNHECAHFQTRKHQLGAGESIGNPVQERFSLITVLDGILHSQEKRTFTAGDTLLLPKGKDLLTAREPANILQTVIP